MKYYQIKPSKSLANYVKYFWVGEVAASKENHFTHFSIATSCSKLVFHYKGKFDEITPAGEQRKSFSSGIQGQSRTHTQFVADENVGIFGVEFFPYAIPFLFSIPAIAITDRFIDLKTFLGCEGEHLEEKIFSVHTDQERVTIITRFLESLLKPFHKLYIIEAIRYINESKGLIDMDSLVKRLPVSQRQFERSFKEVSGFAPKLYARISRFESALGKTRSVNSLTDVALDSGYYDQAHFIHDFKTFTGMHPKHYCNAAPRPTS